MLPGRIDNQYLAVEVQESVQARITILFLTHLLMLSFTDNFVNACRGSRGGAACLR